MMDFSAGLSLQVRFGPVAGHVMPVQLGRDRHLSRQGRPRKVSGLSPCRF